MKVIFFILKGNNGATYILNVKNWKALTNSLNFYKARNLKSKFLKLGLKVLLFIKGKLWKKHFRNCAEIEDYIKIVVKSNVAFEIDTNCSILISPTRDKVIVNHHNQYFQKFAFGQSYHQVKQEAAIYKVFKEPFQNFQLAQLYDEKIQENDCSFKLSNAKLITTKENSIPNNLVAVLIELFNTVQEKQTTVTDYIDDLLDKLNALDIVTNPQQQQLAELKVAYESKMFPLGLVHRDFKPWNIINYDKPLIYDFEEAVMDGPPLEDLFNYEMAPVILYKTPKEVAAIIFDKQKQQAYRYYLNQLGIEINFTLFLHCYLIERIIFWNKKEQYETSNNYLALSNYIITNPLI